MRFTSLTFVLFCTATFTLYYLYPNKKRQWVVLLAASYVFYLWAGLTYASYILITTATTYMAARWIERIAEQRKALLKLHKEDWDKEQKKTLKKQAERKQRAVLLSVLLINFGILAFLKYYSPVARLMNRLFFDGTDKIPVISLIVPLGISFYTFQAMGYVIDVFRGEVKAERNIAKLALFISFFPQILQGPISRYDQLAGQLLAPHRPEWRRFKFGAELILWGLFKKYVIADRAMTAIAAITKSYLDFNGTTLSFAVVLYALQLYADFSAGIDMARGVAQILGIDLIQNFRQPYFATSITEYWNRWHISLGAWMKNYVFYPIALSAWARNVTKRIQNSKIGTSQAGAHIAKVLPGTVASLIVFLIVGIWHGAGWRYILYGLWNGGIIMLSMLLKPAFEKLKELLHIRSSAFLYRVFMMGRTFVLVCIGNITDLAQSGTAVFRWVAKIFTDQDFSVAWGQIAALRGIGKMDYLLLLACTLILFIVGVIREKHPEKPLREILDAKPFILQAVLIVLCVMAILIFGTYGPGYSAADFAYMQF